MPRYSNHQATSVTNPGKRIVAAVKDLPRTVASPWTVHGGLYLSSCLFLFLSTDIRASGIHGESKTYHMRINTGLKVSKPVKSIKELYPSIKWEFGV